MKIPIWLGFRQLQSGGEQHQTAVWSEIGKEVVEGAIGYKTVMDQWVSFAPTYSGGKEIDQCRWIAISTQEFNKLLAGRRIENPLVLAVIVFHVISIWPCWGLSRLRY